MHRAFRQSAKTKKAFCRVRGYIELGELGLTKGVKNMDLAANDDKCATGARIIKKRKKHKVIKNIKSWKTLKHTHRNFQETNSITSDCLHN